MPSDRLRRFMDISEKGGRRDNRELSDNRDLRTENGDLRTRLAQSKDQLKSALSELEDQRETLRDQRKRLDKALSAVREAREAERAAEKRYRQATELLSRCREDLETSIRDHSTLVTKMNRLQQRTDRFSDEELKRTMGQLYLDLDLWVQRHFPRAPSKHKSPDRQNAQISARPVGRLDTVCEIQARVSFALFHNLLWRDRVAISNPLITEMFRCLEQDLQSQCPIHILQHWRAATSTGLFTIRKTRLESLRDKVVEDVLGKGSSTNAPQESKELQELVWDFLLFKQRLECQIEPYRFGWFYPGRSFDNERMNSCTGVYGPDSKVQYTMFPALYRVTEANKETVIVRAKVKALQPPYQRTREV